MTRIARWLPVPGWEDRYEVSDEGLVRSLRDKNGRQRIRPLIARLRKGYLAVKLSRPGQRTDMPVHRLVLLAFRGPPPTPVHQAAHENGRRLDCRLDNLRWATPLENQHDRRRHGTATFGEHHPRARITEAEVREIRASYSGPRDAGPLAERYQISASEIKHIAHRRCWKHVA